MGARESGIILPVPEAEPTVGSYRDAHDPAARLGVPAHITLLYPFAPPDEARGCVRDLAKIVGAVSAFDFSLVEVRRFPETAYLNPDSPAAFVRITERLAEAWPQYPPYGGVFADIVPHLTIADRARPDVLDGVTAAIERQLPIRCRASQVCLMCSDEGGFWTKVESFNLKT
jgi:2'-5' RNA ligase